MLVSFFFLLSFSKKTTIYIYKINTLSPKILHVDLIQAFTLCFILKVHGIQRIRQQYCMIQLFVCWFVLFCSAFIVSLILGFLGKYRDLIGNPYSYCNISI